MAPSLRQIKQHRPTGVRAKSRKMKAAAKRAIYKRWGKVAHTSVANEEPPTTQPPLQGARIIALDRLLASISELTTHSACGGKCTVARETRGLATILYVVCNGCGMHFTLESSTRVNSDYIGNRWTVNVGAVWGQMATGGGSACLNESLALVEVPGISKSVFTSIEEEVGKAWAHLLLEETLKAGAEERRLAIERGEFHQGVPSVPVTVDGGWSKRSHKHSYNAKSGMAVIIGNTTKKILFMGVRNKYCSVCSIAERRQQPPTKHKCYKNWSSSSKAMEADIIAEGFRQAESMHGVRYMKVVGDGDSSVMSTIQDTVHGDPM